jgi:hypothetical protein
MTTAPERGADADESHRADLRFGRQDSPSGTPWMGCVRVGSSLADAIQFCPHEVEVSLASDAVVCGCAGCRAREQLLSVTVNSKTRVACPSCSRKFLDREGADE